jgi:hypothetical protein
VLGKNPTLKPSSNGILGSVNISKHIELPGGVPIDSMHALDLGLFKNLNEIFFNKANKNELFYLGNIFLLLYLYLLFIFIRKGLLLF